jgi:hypothetical protein
MRKLLFVIAFATTSAFGQKPETVLTTYYPKKGKEAEMLRVLRDAWGVYTRLNLMTGGHQLYRAETEGGTVYFVEIFTWRDESIPDNAPAEVKTVWGEMRANTDKLEFAEITPVAEGSSPPASAPSR